MPSDPSIAAHMQARGALPVTIRARLTDSERLVRHAAWRLPMDHADSPLIDRMHAAGLLSRTQYQNACACARLWADCGQGRSRGVASWLREGQNASTGVQRTPEDEWRDLLRTGGVGMQAVCMLLRDEPLGVYMLKRATDHLDTLDAVAAKWDGERYRDE